MDHKNKKAFIFDPSIRFEINENQPEDVDKTKREYYEPTVPYLKNQYEFVNIAVIGLMIGALWSLPKFSDYENHY